MVRLKREIEGVKLDLSVPPPSYAQDPQASALILPSLDRWLLQHEPGRVLLAGVPRFDLARDLAQAGHWLTVTDLDAATVADWHARLGAQLLGKLTLVDRRYGDAAFGPSSFDLVILLDTLHQYREPAWLLKKAAREVKPEGHVALRLPVRGALPDGKAPGRGHPLGKIAQRALQRLQQGLRSPLGPLLADATTLDAIDRGAHLATARFAADCADVLQAVAACLTIDQLWSGDTRRLMACDALFGLRGPLHRTLAKLTVQLAELGDAEDAARTQPRALGVLARRALLSR